MSDNGRWFKLWISAIHDSDLDNLDIADFGRWSKFGAWLKEQGTEGEITLQEPCRLLCSMMQLSTFNDVISCIQKFPNVTVSSETNTHVSFKVKWENWHKYQGDFSTNRVHKFRAKKRQNETPKKRREEKREEEKKKEDKEKDFITSLKSNPAYKEIDIDRELSKMDAWLSTPKGKGRKKTTAFILNWLNKIDVSIPSKVEKIADQYKPL